MSKLAVVIANYRTGDLVDAFKRSLEPTTIDHTLIEIDNGYRDDRPATIKTARNIYCAPAQLLGVEYMKALEIIDNVHYDYLFLPVTCCSMVEKNDPLAKMVSFMEANPNCVICHPAFDASSNTAWPNMHARTNAPRRTYAVDNVAIMFRRSFYDEIGGIDRRYLRGWCIGLDMSYQARKMGKEIWLLDDVLCHRTESLGWIMGRRDVSREAYNQLAAAEMDKTVEEKFHRKPPEVYEYLNYSFSGEQWRIK